MINFDILWNMFIKFLRDWSQNKSQSKGQIYDFRELLSNSYDYTVSITLFSQMFPCNVS